MKTLLVTNEKCNYINTVHEYKNSLKKNEKYLDILIINFETLIYNIYINKINDFKLIDITKFFHLEIDNKEFYTIYSDKIKFIFKNNLINEIIIKSEKKNRK